MEEFKFYITDFAIKTLNNNLVKENALYVRIGVKGSGCAGYSYVIDYQRNDSTTKDLIFEFNSLKVFIDNKSIILLNGTILDYKNSLMKSGFKFINPNATYSCGCGESFS